MEQALFKVGDLVEAITTVDNNVTEGTIWKITSVNLSDNGCRLEITRNEAPALDTLYIEQNFRKTDLQIGDLVSDVSLGRIGIIEDAGRYSTTDEFGLNRTYTVKYANECKDIRWARELHKLTSAEIKLVTDKHF